MFAEVGAGYETNVAAAAIFPLLTKHVTCTTLLQLPVRVASPVSSWVYGEIVWLARPSHLIAGALRAGKGRSSGSND